jgi:hypothetical protein
MANQKISDAMWLVLDAASKFGFQGEVICNNRKTEDALIRRGLITYEYDDRKFYSVKVLGYRYPILTVAGWVASGNPRPDDHGRYSLEQALVEIEQLKAVC